MKRLIVNADDFGRTQGVNEGTLEAHLAGIVTSATVMVLESAAAAGIREALERAPELSLGLHFMLTGGGAPASDPAAVSALAPGGKLARNAEALPERLPAGEVRRELEAQIALFETYAGRPPSHLDSHHHCALHASVQPVFAEVARERDLPVRAASESARQKLRAAGLRVPDHFLDAFYAEGATEENLRRLLWQLPDGTSELMCHPGHADEALRRGSSYAAEREGEIEVLADPALFSFLEELGIDLIPFHAL